MRKLALAIVLVLIATPLAAQENGSNTSADPVFYRSGQQVDVNVKPQLRPAEDTTSSDSSAAETTNESSAASSVSAEAQVESPPETSDTPTEDTTQPDTNDQAAGAPDPAVEQSTFSLLGWPTLILIALAVILGGGFVFMTMRSSGVLARRQPYIPTPERTPPPPPSTEEPHKLQDAIEEMKSQTGDDQSTNA